MLRMTSHFKMDNSGVNSNVSILIIAIVGLLLVSVSGGYDVKNEKGIHGMLTGAEDMAIHLKNVFDFVTGSGIYKDQKDLVVQVRDVQNMKMLLDRVKGDMERVMKLKSKTVERLKFAAEREMKKYGPYKQDINFENVSYYNAKKVVIWSDISSMSNESQIAIKDTINYLRTEPTWDFKGDKSLAQLNEDTSSIHVPTNIYDKSMKILNGVQWTKQMTKQFVTNRKNDPLLTWQYFCSSDGFFRIYPGMQWPRNADRVDTFDCRVRQWYIQAASSPKNLVILLDASGSMKGLRFSIAKSTVFTILDTLSDEDYFNVIMFSDEPKYVVECFNGTLMPANVDNIRRMKAKIEELEAKRYANFEKALSLAFNLFLREKYHHGGQKICNKAIMMITDGAPDNFDYIFDHFNWPNKTQRVFTFLIGKEVQDNRQARWMACANKGKFTHISTRADVQENVQKYVKVLSRPLVMLNETHKAWSGVYLDYVTQQADILATPGIHTQVDVDFEKSYQFQGLGLVMSISMPVYDQRRPDRVGPMEEDPSTNMLGVVGADLRINELLQRLPTYELGVNGYAFAITNHGYILFHPDYKPFYTEQKAGRFRLKARPKYNSVELSEVERPVAPNNEHRESTLTHYLLIPRAGDFKFTVKAYYDSYMRRVEKRENLYVFTEVAEMFRLVFVVPTGYGLRYISTDQSFEEAWKKYNQSRAPAIDASRENISPWVYCKMLDGEGLTQMSGHRDYQRKDVIKKKCHRTHALHLLKDSYMAYLYSRVWQGNQSYHVGSSYDNKYAKDYDACYSENGFDKLMCFLVTHNDKHGIEHIWIATRTGIVRNVVTNRTVQYDPKYWHQDHIQSIKSPNYKRTVSLWNAGYEYTITGPASSSETELDFEVAHIIMSHVEAVGIYPEIVPAAVVSISMRYTDFHELFVKHTFLCNRDDCFYTCNNTEHFNCYIVDNNGYIMATNNPSKNGTSLFLGLHDGYLMRALIDDKIFEGIEITDFQSICREKVEDDEDNASNFVINPLQLISRCLAWFLSRVGLILSHLTVMAWYGITGIMGLGDLIRIGDEKVCGDWIPEAYVRYIFCGFIQEKATGDSPKVAILRSCELRVTRYNLNLDALRHRKTLESISPCQVQCENNKPFYNVRRLNPTNLLFVVADASCQCGGNSSLHHTSGLDEEQEEEEEVPYDFDHGRPQRTKESKERYTFSMKAEEVTYPEHEQCQRLRNLSEELKNVDITRKLDTVCYDSTQEEDTPCNHSSLLTSGLDMFMVSILLSVLHLWLEGSSVR